MKNINSLFLPIICCLLFVSSPAYAMHISEGILPLNWALFWFAAAFPFVVWGLRKLNKLSAVDISVKPLVGLMAAAVFIISCMPIPVPTAGTCSHPCGTAISAILLGPAISILITAAALLIQALFLAHGGISTWGADIISMGVIGSLTGFLTFKLLRLLKASLAVSAFAAGMLADWMTYLTTSVELTLGIRQNAEFGPLFWKILIAFIPTQLPLGIIEGAMTAGIITLLYRKRADLLVKLRVIRPAITLSILLIIPALAFAQEQKYKGVDETVVEKYAKEYGREIKAPFINTDKGDLLLFVFLLAGAAGGFAAGYYWKTLMIEKPFSPRPPRPTA